jgi:hypothetical protein
MKRLKNYLSIDEAPHTTSNMSLAIEDAIGRQLGTAEPTRVKGLGKDDHF